MPPLEPIAEEVRAGRRLSRADGEALFACRDLHALGAMADEVRQRRHGRVAYYNVNRHIHYTNVCVLGCAVCGFSRRPGSADAYELSIEEVARQARRASQDGATEVHLTGGLHPHWPMEHYEEMLRAIRLAGPGLHIKAFTAVEIAHFAAVSGIETAAALDRLAAAGLDSMPVGGAEIFDSRARKNAFPGKISAEEWLDVHRLAHQRGIPTNATMLYGFGETTAERVDHLVRLRGLQEETGGFQAFVPLPFVPPGQAAAERTGPTGLDDLKTIAAARLMLDNFEHVKTFWVMHTPKLSEVALHFGADDVHGTVGCYDIARPRPGREGMTAEELRRLIRRAGLTPVERDSLYQRVELLGRGWSAQPRR